MDEGLNAAGQQWVACGRVPIAGQVLTLMTLWAGRGGRANSGTGVVFFVGSLALIMLMLSPVCHSHYFALEVPLVTGLLAVSWMNRRSLTGPYLGSGPTNPMHWPMFGLCAIVFVGNRTMEVGQVSARTGLPRADLARVRYRVRVEGGRAVAIDRDGFELDGLSEAVFQNLQRAVTTANERLRTGR